MHPCVHSLLQAAAAFCDAAADQGGYNSRSQKRGKSLLQGPSSNKSQDLSGIDLQPFFSTPQSSIGGAGGGNGSTPGSRVGSARLSGCGALGSASRSGAGWLVAPTSLEEAAAAEAAAGAALAAAVASRSASMAGASPAAASCSSSVTKSSRGPSRAGDAGTNSFSSSSRGGKAGPEQQQQQAAAVKLERQRSQPQSQGEGLGINEASPVAEEVSAQDPWVEGSSPSGIEDGGNGEDEEVQAGSSRTARQTQEEEASSIDTSKWLVVVQPSAVVTRPEDTY